MRGRAWHLCSSESWLPCTGYIMRTCEIKRVYALEEVWTLSLISCGTVDQKSPRCLFAFSAYHLMSLGPHASLQSYTAHYDLAIRYVYFHHYKKFYISSTKAAWSVYPVGLSTRLWVMNSSWWLLLCVGNGGLSHFETSQCIYSYVELADWQWQRGPDVITKSLRITQESVLVSNLLEEEIFTINIVIINEYFILKLQ